MAAAYIFGGGTPNPHCQRVTLPPKPYFKLSQSHYFTTLHPQPPKIRAFSVRACGRANNDRLSPSDAIDFSGRRVTIGDVVSKDSLRLNQAQKALQALAADTNGRLQVWDDGVFPKNLAVKLFSIKFESLLEKGKMATAYLMRVSFSASLAASSVVRLTVAVCVAFILRIIGSTEASSVVDDIRNAFTNLCSAELIECVFSYVFGDGDPNQGLEEKRWKMIGQYIALNGGVVTAEEIVPYLDPETTGKMDNDSKMLPVLQRFDGQPKVDEEGNILYHFPSVHCTPLPRISSKGICRKMG